MLWYSITANSTLSARSSSIISEAVPQALHHVPVPISRITFCRGSWAYKIPDNNITIKRLRIFLAFIVH